LFNVSIKYFVLVKRSSFFSKCRSRPQEECEIGSNFWWNISQRARVCVCACACVCACERGREIERERVINASKFRLVFFQFLPTEECQRLSLNGIPASRQLSLRLQYTHSCLHFILHFNLGLMSATFSISLSLFL